MTKHFGPFKYDIKTAIDERLIVNVMLKMNQMFVELNKC